MPNDTYTKNQHGFKPASQTYRMMEGVRYEQWTDNCSNRTEGKKLIQQFEQEHPGYKFVCRKISDGYRIYKISV